MPLIPLEDDWRTYKLCPPVERKVALLMPPTSGGVRTNSMEMMEEPVNCDDPVTSQQTPHQGVGGHVRRGLQLFNF